MLRNPLKSNYLSIPRQLAGASVLELLGSLSTVPGSTALSAKEKRGSVIQSHGKLSHFHVSQRHKEKSHQKALGGVIFGLVKGERIE
jgi:hypothetical protein